MSQNNVATEVVLPVAKPYQAICHAPRINASAIDEVTMELYGQNRPVSDMYNYDAFQMKVRPLLQKYEAAMRAMEVRSEIVNSDLSVRCDRNPIHHIESRIKTPKSMFEKLLRYDKKPTIENAEKYLMDIAGLRLICCYMHDVYRMFDLLQHQDDIEIVRVKDYIQNPKPNGYRSLHIIVRIPVRFMDYKQMIPVEIQIRTIGMDFWASLEHDLRYKAISEVHGADTFDELKNCSEIIENVEGRMQVLARALEQEY